GGARPAGRHRRGSARRRSARRRGGARIVGLVSPLVGSHVHSEAVCRNRRAIWTTHLHRSRQRGAAAGHRGRAAQPRRGQRVSAALVSTESAPPRAVAWPLPAGPWREDWSALGRADVIIVTRRRAAIAESHRLAARIATRWPSAVVASVHLAVEGLRGLRSGGRVSLSLLARKRVVVAAGIADPVSFAAQVRATGATVQLMAYQDH